MGPPLLGGPSWAKVGWGIGAVEREAGGYKRQPGIATSAPTLKGMERACDKRAEELALWGAARLLVALAEGWGGTAIAIGHLSSGALVSQVNCVPGGGRGVLLCAFAEGE